MAALELTVNGEPLRAEAEPHTTLLAWLRARGLTSVKEGCAEGECGACAVVLVRPAGRRESRFEAVNSCLVLACAVAGAEVLTAEGLAEPSGDLHAVQAAMAEGGGSQCGYCTPGFVMSLFAEHHRVGREAVELESIAGNLCRCTGYRPIRDAARSLPPADPASRFARRLQAPTPAPSALRLEGRGAIFHRPTTLPALFEILCAAPDAKIVAGGTDVVVEINQRDARHGVLVSLEAIDALRGITVGDDAIVIGACEPLSSVEARLGAQVPMFGQLLPLFSSRLVRNRATFGGNLANASPIGDGAPALLALDAELVLRSASGERTAALEGFFVGYRETLLAPGEIITAIRIPRPLPTTQRFYKVSKRELDDISTVAAGFSLTRDEAGAVRRARLAYGGVAATPMRARDAERALEGAPLSRASVARARAAAMGAFTPIADHRGSAEYRRAMIGRLLDKLWAHERTTEGVDDAGGTP